MSVAKLKSAGVLGQTRVELRLLWRGFVLPICLVICALLAVANVDNTAGSVRADYGLVQHTRAEYAANGMNFAADLKKPAKVTTSGDEQSVTNLARYDYDTMASAVIAISPASSVTESMKYFGFLLYPLVFFLVGLWLATGQRRYRLEKVTLVRAGTARTVAARQLALLVVSAIVTATILVVDAVSRAIATSMLAAQLPLSAFSPLSPQPVQNSGAQLGVIVLVILFFGGAGIAVGAFTGAFAIPAIVFLIWDYIVPFLGVHDPRNWFDVLGHAVYSYASTFELSPAIPLAVPVALTAALLGAVLLLGLGYLGIRIRNPLAT
ncbi:MAG TPA: hypothetical protein VIJ11_10540 [Galbitalea sp.]